MGNSYKRQMIAKETGFVIQEYQKHKRKKSIETSRDKKSDEVEI